MSDVQDSSDRVEHDDSDVHPEALAIAYDAIRDGEFWGIPENELVKAFANAHAAVLVCGYETLGSPNDPGTFEEVRTGDADE